MAKKETAVTKPLSEEQKSILKNSFPVEPGFQRIQLPRLGMFSQDVTEGKGKNTKVVSEAGTFYTDKQTEDTDENGKKIWNKEELGTTISGVILFQRKQLKMYDGDTQLYTSSGVYDTDNDMLKLWCDKKEVASGTAKELKAKYEYKAEDGKTKSKLEENRILYVLFEGEIYQMNLRGSSMYSFLTYSRKVNPPQVVTRFSSEAKEKGTISWNMMTFEVDREITGAEFEQVVGHIESIKNGIAVEKAFFASTVEATEEEKINSAKEADNIFGV